MDFVGEETFSGNHTLFGRGNFPRISERELEFKSPGMTLMGREEYSGGISGCLRTLEHLKIHLKMSNIFSENYQHVGKNGELSENF